MFSDYTNAPRHEICRVIEWYRSIEEDARINIRRLESLLAERERYARYRRNLNEAAMCLADQVHGADIVAAVANATGTPPERAARIAGVVKVIHRKRARRARNDELVALSARIPVSQLARDYGLSRQTVSRIVNTHKKRPLG